MFEDAVESSICPLSVNNEFLRIPYEGPFCAIIIQQNLKSIPLEREESRGVNTFRRSLPRGKTSSHCSVRPNPIAVRKHADKRLQCGAPFEPNRRPLTCPATAPPAPPTNESNDDLKVPGAAACFQGNERQGVWVEIVINGPLSVRMKAPLPFIHGRIFALSQQPFPGPFPPSLFAKTLATVDSTLLSVSSTAFSF